MQSSRAASPSARVHREAHRWASNLSATRAYKRNATTCRPTCRTPYCAHARWLSAASTSHRLVRAHLLMTLALIATSTMTQVPRLWRSLGVAQQAQALRLWVSTRGAVTPLHFDAADSFLAQMRGTKRVTFFPPSAIDGLYPYPVDHPLFRRARVDLYQDPAERGVRFPAFGAHAEADAQVVELREGDVVLFPRYWWHHIETVSELSCSIGCRYVS